MWIHSITFATHVDPQFYLCDACGSTVLPLRRMWIHSTTFATHVDPQYYLCDACGSTVLPLRRMWIHSITLIAHHCLTISRHRLHVRSLAKITIEEQGETEKRLLESVL
jgi:hypothetical protein